MTHKPDALEHFVHDALAAGVARGEITRALRASGWDALRIERALAAFADMQFPVPVPRPVAAVSAREAFFYLVLFASLGGITYRLGTLLFAIIERAFPDPADAPFHLEMQDWEVRWSIAGIAISFPLFLFMADRINRALANREFSAASPVRLWLSYLAMFLAVAALMSDLTTLIAYLLAGEATTRFLVKVATVAVIALAVLAYYLRTLRGAEAGRGEMA